MLFNYKGKNVAIDLSEKNQELIIMEDNGVVVLKILSRAKIDSISKGVMIVSGFDEVSSNKFKKVLIPFHRAQYKVGT